MKPPLKTQVVAPAKQRGVGLVTAIFLLVVLAGLGAALLNISTSQQVSSAMDVQGARAYQAARAGTEWGLFQRLRANSCVGAQTFVPPAPTLSAFTVTVRCVLRQTPAVGAAGASPAAAINGTLDTTVNVTAIADTSVLREGMEVWGTGIVVGTRIAAITGANTVMLTIAATATGTRALTYVSARDRWHLTSTACTQPVSGACPNANPTSSDYVQRTVEADI